MCCYLDLLISKPELEKTIKPLTRNALVDPVWWWLKTESYSDTRPIARTPSFNHGFDSNSELIRSAVDFK